jgi:Fe-S oxidoreductase
MNIQTILFVLVLAGSFAFLFHNARRLIGYLRIGRAEDRTGNPALRVRNVLTIAFGQAKLLREPFAGALHFLIFWGFVILLSAILETIGEGVSTGFTFSFLGPLYPPLAFLQDLVGVLVIASCTVSLLRRYIAPPKRLDIGGHARTDATVILLLILCIIGSMFAQNGANIARGVEMANSVRFASSTAALMFSGMGGETVETWFMVFWWMHILLVLGFMNYLPYSKHLHILTSIPNVYLAKTGKRGTLRSLDLADEKAVRFGAADVEDLTWKQLLDGYTCTECGRCTSACPAAGTGKLLSPKKIIVDIRRRLMERAPGIVAGEGTGEGGGVPETPPAAAGGGQLVDGYITEQELWACTTCMACVQECPVQIEHVDAIVDMRRYLVLNESRFPKEMQQTFENLERNFTPWAFSHSARADWAADLGIPRIADKRDAAILFWVGCAGAYDARYSGVTRAFARLMKIAGVDFAILGTEEKCTGDPARRAGNEYLAQMLMNENVGTLNGYGVKKIVTTCPHCFNMLLNEYPEAGGRFEVVHHTDFLMGLIDSGRIRLSREQRARITYHDSCYLGRYNDVYDQPRKALAGIPGVDLREMPRNRDRGFCCGAGGARMFMEETEGKRVNVERTEEALATTPDVIGTACPFCMTMMTDGVKEKDEAERVRVRDIAEIILDAVEEGGSS